MSHANSDTSSRTQARPYDLAIDLGSGAIKVALVSVSGRIIAFADERISTFLLPDGGAEQDAGQRWDLAKTAAKKVVAASNVSPADIVAIACDSQWSVVIPVQ